MAERVAAFGGSVSAERTADGFRLHVVLPLEERA
jgi:signal transduction histidine kinase